MGQDGTLIKHEVLGPQNFNAWEASFKVLRTALIELDVVKPSHLGQYRDLIWRFVQRYQPAVWPLIYQADVRARREQLERIRRRLHSS
eukprot:5698148-Amphidinium_carterae.1